MYVAHEASISRTGEFRDGAVAPGPLDRLYRRERQIAGIVYRRGLATASDIEAELGGELSNPAIRSMLNRLVAKGFLTRVKCGRFGTFVYAPAVTDVSARETALREFAQDFYAGSLSSLAEAIADLFARQNSKVREQPRRTAA
jgi:predicted transcriptional regulator